jgi:hypothetical protein
MKIRYILPAAALMLISASHAVAQGGVDCKDLAQANAVNASFEADETAKRSALNTHTAERLYRIDAEAKALIGAGVWTDADRRAYFGKQRAAPAYGKLEQSKKEPLFSVQMGRSTASGIKATNPSGACSYALNTLAAYDELQTITDTQYDMLENGIREIAAGKNLTLKP